MGFPKTTDVKNKIDFKVPFDISTATVLTYKIKQPVSRTIKEFTPVVLTDGTDGRVRYTRQANDLIEEGVHLCEFYCEWADGTKFTSDPEEFTLEPPLS